MIDLHVEADPEGLPPLLLLHGFLSSPAQWGSNASLSRHFRCIRAALPGHAGAPAPDRAADYHPDALAAALDALRVRLGIERWAICGASFGAAITLRHALDRPDRVTAQVFTNANGAFRTAWSDEMLAAHQARIDALLREGASALRRFPYHPAHARRFPPELRARLARDADGCDVGAVLHLLREAMTRLSVLDRFAQTRVPTLLINGRRERAFQPVRDLAVETLPALQVVDLDGGHSVNVEAPEAFDTAMTGFLSEWVVDARHR